MFTQNWIEEIRSEMELRDLVRLLPDPMEINETDTRWGQIRTMNIWEMGKDHTAYIQHAWMDVYYSLLRKLAEVFIGRKEYFVIRMIPYVFEKDFRSVPNIKIGCFVECFVAESRNIVIPQITYQGENFMKEWRCGSCGTPNPLKENSKPIRLCTQCGAPRALLIQEIMDDLHNGMDVCNL